MLASGYLSRAVLSTKYFYLDKSYERVSDGLCRAKVDLMSSFARGGGFLFCYKLKQKKKVKITFVKLTFFEN